MKPPVRSFSTSSRSRRTNEPEPFDPKQPVDARNKGGSHASGPAVIYVPPHTTQEELENLVAATKSGVLFTGAAALGATGPMARRIEISEKEDAYRFRVLLPGVSCDEKDFSCKVGPGGKILVKGITTTGAETDIKHSHVFKMQAQNFCPRGHFSVTFQLPGPVEDQLLDGSFVNGILEGTVKKRLSGKGR